VLLGNDGDDDDDDDASHTSGSLYQLLTVHLPKRIACKSGSLCDL